MGWNMFFGLVELSFSYLRDPDEILKVIFLFLPPPLLFSANKLKMNHQMTNIVTH